MKLELSRPCLAFVSAYLKSFTGFTFDFLSRARMFCRRRSIIIFLSSGNWLLIKSTNVPVLAYVSFVATMLRERNLPKAGEAKMGNISANPSSCKKVPCILNLSRGKGSPDYSSYCCSYHWCYIRISNPTVLAFVSYPFFEMLRYLMRDKELSDSRRPPWNACSVIAFSWMWSSSRVSLTASITVWNTFLFVASDKSSLRLPRLSILRRLNLLN